MGPLPPGFSQVFILKGVKVLCFDTDLQVFILKVLRTRFAVVKISRASLPHPFEFSGEPEFHGAVIDDLLETATRGTCHPRAEWTVRDNHGLLY